MSKSPTDDTEEVSSQSDAAHQADDAAGSDTQQTGGDETRSKSANENGESGAGGARGGSGDQLELRFLIASKSAGAIIGKAGANIKRLRETYHARISVPDSDGPDRVVTVECGRESVRELLTELFQALLDDEKRNATQGGNGNGSGATGSTGSSGAAAATTATATATATTTEAAGAASGSSSGLTEADARLLIHQSQAGCLIGKEGAKIKQLRSELALRVLKIFPECCPRSTERVVQMLGEPRAIVDAVMAIHDVLAANPAKGARFAYNPGMVDALQNAYGGWPVPYGASFGGGAGAAAGGHGLGPGPRRGGYGGPGAGAGAGPGAGGFRRGGMGGGAMRGGSAGAYRGPGGAPGGAPVYGGFDLLSGNAMYPAYGAGSHDGIVTTQVSLPDRLTGCIMGRGGQRIQQIRTDSGAEIRVDNAQPGRDRVITIRGSMHQIQSAQYLLQQCVRKFGGMSP